MDYTFILDQIYNLISNNNILLAVLILIPVLLLFFIISRTFRKSGLFLLALTFLADQTIKNLPYDIYGSYPIAYNIVTGFFIVGFINFFIRVLLMVRKASKKEKEDSKLNSFFKFTGIRPFIVMLIINLANYNSFIPKGIVSLFTSLSFLYMAFRTLYSTYLYLSTKEKIGIDDGMDFEDIDAYINSDTPKKNQNRIIKRKTKENIDDKKENFDNKGEEDVKIFSNKEKNIYTNPISMSDIKEEKAKEETIKNIEKDISNTDMINMIEDKSFPNITTISLTDLSKNTKETYTSEKASFKLHEDDQYQVELEFEKMNDYDYGRFVDMLLKYYYNRNDYKFELSVSPSNNKDFKIILYDPSKVLGSDSKEALDISGKIITMDFPKYKINFVKDNY